MTKNKNDLPLEKLAKVFPIILSDYDPKWQNLFEEEKKLLLSSLHNQINNVVHIGSTAIPGMKAKPTIDILLEIKDDTNLETLKTALRKLGYSTTHDAKRPPPHLTLIKGYSMQGATGQTYHLHIRYKNSRDEIIFRDYLKENPKAHKDYKELKELLAKQYRCDRKGYSEAKTDFVVSAVNKAKKF